MVDELCVYLEFTVFCFLKAAGLALLLLLLLSQKWCAMIRKLDGCN
jgi:hypothetical protein